MLFYYRLNPNPEDNDEKIDVTSNASSSGSIIVAPPTVEKEISTATMSKPTLSLSDASAANAAQAVAASGNFAYDNENSKTSLELNEL